MFERFSHQGRDVVTRAHAVAQAAGAEAIGVEHFVLALAAAGQDFSSAAGWMAFTPDAKALLERAAQSGPDAGPAHIALALVELGHAPADWDVETAREVLGAAVAAPPRISDPEGALRAGEPVAVTLGIDALPLGDIGDARTDACVLLAILAAGGPVAQMLRAAGIDEAELRRRASGG